MVQWPLLCYRGPPSDPIHSPQERKQYRGGVNGVKPDLLTDKPGDMLAD